MKDIFLKALVILPIIVFIDYCIMIIVGCTGGYLGFNTNFYECAFCTIGKVVLSISLLVFLYTISKDIFSHHKQRNQVC
jgi:uncharacterized membrane protein